MDSRWKQPNLQLSMYFTICALFFFLFRCLVLSNFRWNMHIWYRLLLLKICMHNMHIQSTFSSTADTERKHESTREREAFTRKMSSYEKRKKKTAKTINSNECQKYWKYSFVAADAAAAAAVVIVICIALACKLWYVYYDIRFMAV